MNKDWTGNKKSTYTTLGASNHSDKERQEHDLYCTDPSAIDDLFAVEKFSDYIWEPACGMGHLAKRMVDLGKRVYATDLYEYGYGKSGMDFLLESKVRDMDIITNPPYKYAEQFVTTALNIIPDGRKVAMFLKLTFLEGKARKNMYAKYPPKVVYVYSYRKNCAMNGDFEKYKQATAIAYCWYVWEKGNCNNPIIKWI